MQLRDNQISVSYGDSGTCGCPSDRRTKVADVSIPLNQWVLVAAVVRGPTDMGLFVNGSEVPGTYSGTGGPMIHNA